MDIILASQSPRRKELLTKITPNFTVHISHVNETYDKCLAPHEIVTYLSQLKTEAVQKEFPDDLIIGADTIVSLNQKILEKPINESHAYEMLNQLSNKTHQVITGVTVLFKDNKETFFSTTDVTFYELTDKEINDYIKTKEPFDKAGAYGIQGYASKFIKEIKGDYFTVVGLPVGELYQRLKKYL